MSTETRRALIFIIVGCLLSTAVGVIVWRASTPSASVNPSPDSSLAPSPASFMAPPTTTATGSEVQNIPAAPVDTEDPFLAPNAHINEQPAPGALNPGQPTPLTPWEPALPDTTSASTLPQTPGLTSPPSPDPTATDSPRPTDFTEEPTLPLNPQGSASPETGPSSSAELNGPTTDQPTTQTPEPEEHTPDPRR